MTLRPHQTTAIDFLLQTNRRAILADAAGLGKTLSILTALFTKPKQFPVLVVCNKPGLSVWENELHKWFDEEAVIYTGAPKKRAAKLQIFLTSSGINFLITNYAFFEEVLFKLTPIFFKTLIMDEYHLPGLLNRKTKIYKFTKSVAKLIPYIILATGTPMRQNPSDWFAPLSIIDPETFSSYWNFVNNYCIVIQEEYGCTIERMPLNQEKFSEMLDKYRRRCVDKSYLPPKTRQPIPIEMTPKQARLYNTLVDQMILDEDGSFIITPNKLTNVLRCRQLLVCPTILGFNELGRAMEVMVDLVIEELSEGNPVAIFTPFRFAVNIIKKQLEEVIKDSDIYTIMGGMTLEQYNKVQIDFQFNPNKNKVLISTIKSGTTATYTEASVAIFIGYEYNVNDNTQAEDRLFREGQTKKVRCYYLLYKDSAVDSRALEILNDKSKALAIDINREEYYRKIIDNNIVK